MESADLNVVLLWTLRVACPVFLVLWVRWSPRPLPAFMLLILAEWVRWLGFYNEYSIEPTRTSDLILGTLKALAVTEALKACHWLLLISTALFGAAVSAGVYGYEGDWETYESLKLMLHCGLAMCLIGGVLWWRLKWNGDWFSRRHAGLLLALMCWHITIRLWPLPPLPTGAEPAAIQDAMNEARTVAWYSAQAVFRAGFLLLLVLWLFLVRSVVRTARRGNFLRGNCT